MGEPPARSRYRFGPLERRGLIAGWRGGQILGAAGGVALAIAVLRAHPGPGSIGLALVAGGAGVAVGWWPIAGRSAEEWLPTIVRWGRSPRGTRRWRSPAPAAGHCVGPDGVPCLGAGSHDCAGARPGARDGAITGAAPVGHGPRPSRHGAGPRVPRLAGPWGRLALIDVTTPEGEPIGVVHDAVERTCTFAVRLLGHSFALLGRAEQDRRVAAWASVLAAHGRERPTVRRLQWIVATLPDDGSAVRGHLASAGVLPPDAPAHRAYSALVDAGAETCRHEVILAVQVRVASPRGAGPAGARPLAGTLAFLGREVAGLRRQLAGADVTVGGVLDARRLAGHIGAAVAGESGAGRSCAPCTVAWPWPVTLEAHWDCVRADATWHATYWVGEWPRTDVGAEFLAPLLLGSVRRRVALVMEPLSPSRAMRYAQRARTADIADDELRRRGGFTATARRAREAAVAVQREEELADGHASLRFSGYVTVTADTRVALADACDATTEAAAQSHLELRRLYGEQAGALACTLPLCRGLV